LDGFSENRVGEIYLVDDFQEEYTVDIMIKRWKRVSTDKNDLIHADFSDREGIVFIDALEYIGKMDFTTGKLQAYFYKPPERVTYEDNIGIVCKLHGAKKSCKCDFSPDKYLVGGLTGPIKSFQGYEGPGVYEVSLLTKDIVRRRKEKTYGDAYWYKRALEKMIQEDFEIHKSTLEETEMRYNRSSTITKMFPHILELPDGFLEIDPLKPYRWKLSEIPVQMIYPGRLIRIDNRHYMTKLVRKNRSGPFLEAENKIYQVHELKFKRLFEFYGKTVPDST